MDLGLTTGGAQQFGILGQILLDESDRCVMACSGSRIMTDAEVQCMNCLKRIKVKIFSAGLSDAIPFTCDRDPTVLTIATWDKTIASLLGEYPSSEWTENHYKIVEAQLKTCPCGGTFKHDVLPKCPNCGAILRVEGLGSSEFVVVGRLIDGEKENPWQLQSRTQAQVSTG